MEGSERNNSKSKNMTTNENHLVQREMINLSSNNITSLQQSTRRLDEVINVQVNSQMEAMVSDEAPHNQEENSININRSLNLEPSSNIQEQILRANSANNVVNQALNSDSPPLFHVESSPFNFREENESRVNDSQRSQISQQSPISQNSQENTGQVLLRPTNNTHNTQNRGTNNFIRVNNARVGIQEFLDTHGERFIPFGCILKPLVTKVPFFEKPKCVVLSFYLNFIFGAIALFNMSKNLEDSYRVEYALVLYVIDTIMELICFGLIITANRIVPPFPKKVLSALFLRTIATSSIVINLTMIGPEPFNKVVGSINFVFTLPLILEPFLTSLKSTYPTQAVPLTRYHSDLLKNSSSWCRLVGNVTVLMVCLKRMLVPKMKLWVVVQPAVLCSMIFFFFSVILITGFIFGLLFGVCNCWRQWRNKRKGLGHFSKVILNSSIDLLGLEVLTVLFFLFLPHFYLSVILTLIWILKEFNPILCLFSLFYLILTSLFPKPVLILF